MSYIYFIQAQDDGPIKIGFTGDNPRKRMVEIQSRVVLGLFNYLAQSKARSRKKNKSILFLGRYKTNGEWFEPHPHCFRGREFGTGMWGSGS